MRRPARGLSGKNCFYCGSVVLTGKARDGLDQREVGLARAMLVEALAVRDPDRLPGVQLLQKAIGQRALADTRLSGQEDELAPPRACALKTSRELSQLRGAPDEP